jgi:hypothetical protein
MNKKLQEYEKIAQKKMKEVLSDFIIDENLKSDMAVGYTKDENIHVWDLYIPQERPAKGISIAEARLDPKTLEVEVEIFENPYMKHK